MIRIQNVYNKPIMFQKVPINAGSFCDFVTIYDYTKLTQLVNSGKVLYFEVTHTQAKIEEPVVEDKVEDTISTVKVDDSVVCKEDSKISADVESDVAFEKTSIDENLFTEEPKEVPEKKQRGKKRR